MNRKGFAISIVMYSIVFLIVTILYMLVGVVRNRYVINENLRGKVTAQINSEAVLVDPDDYLVGSCQWVDERTHFDLEPCYASTPPDTPSEGDHYVDFLENKYTYTGEYSCRKNDGTTTTTRVISEQTYDFEDVAYDACDDNAPACTGLPTIKCSINKYYKCKIYKYTCGEAGSPTPVTPTPTCSKWSWVLDGGHKTPNDDEGNKAQSTAIRYDSLPECNSSNEGVKQNVISCGLGKAGCATSSGYTCYDRNTNPCSNADRRYTWKVATCTCKS